MYARSIMWPIKFNLTSKKGKLLWDRIASPGPVSSISTIPGKVLNFPFLSLCCLRTRL